MRRLNEKLLIENIERVAQFDISNNKIFGSSYFVYQKGNLAVEKNYGTVALNSDIPVTNLTLFRLASMTKPITAFATLILVDRGVLSLDDRVDKYLPEFKNIHIIDMEQNDFGLPQNPPTIRHILSHTSGIGSSGSLKLQNMNDYDRKTTDAMVDFLVRTGLDFEPTTKEMYSGVGAFDVLTKIIELISGMDYLSFLEKEIFTPCGMKDTTFTPNIEQWGRMVAMHAKINGENAESEMQKDCIFENFPCTHYLGGAGLVSSLRDYCNFAKLLLNRGKTENKRLLSEETFNQLCTPQVSKEDMCGKEHWGLGVRVVTGKEYPYLPIGTFGWSGAYGSHFWIDPENEIFAVFMKNSRYDGGGGNQSATNFERAVYTSF